MKNFSRFFSFINKNENTSNHKAYPLALLIGGMRCGTRAFLKYMQQHPQICVHKQAHDPDFFSNTENYTKGLDWYLSGWKHFLPDQHKYAFESSTHYTKYPSVDNVPLRMFESKLNIHFLYILRDPILRIESHMIHNAGKGYFNPSDQKKRARFLKFALNYSKYNMQLEQFLQFFPQEKIFLFKQEKLRNDYQKVMNDVTSFLGIEEYNFKPVKTVQTKFKTNVDGLRLTKEEVDWLRSELQNDITVLKERFEITDDMWDLFSGKETRELLNQSSLGQFENKTLITQTKTASPQANKTSDQVSKMAPGIIHGPRYAMLTVDTEALGNRTTEQHVRRLIWGEFYNGRAGIRELSSICRDFSSKLTFFVDTCSTEFYGNEINQVISWLDSDGQDVQLHVHPEQLPVEYWEKNGFTDTPRMFNKYNYEKALFTLSTFSKVISDITKKPVLGFRAGSFRWNYNTIKAMGDIGISLSFNNRYSAFMRGLCSHSEKTNYPYRWTNEVIEIPQTEYLVQKSLKKEKWTSFKYPLNPFGSNSPEMVMGPVINKDSNQPFLVLLLHSWSLLYQNENGYFEYRDDQRIEEFRELVKKISVDYDIITCPDFLNLLQEGKIKIEKSVRLQNE